LKIREIKEIERTIINETVEVHMNSFKGFFLTFLGKGFLRQLYNGFVEHKDSGLIVVQEKGVVVGFLAYSQNMSAFYKYLLKKHFISFAFYAFGGFVRKPKVFFRLIRALTYSKEAKREEKYIELSSIGINPDCSNKGIGSKLIDELKESVKGTTAEYIKLETDAENNEKANHFYIKNGFVLHHTYETREKRKMHEYRFYLH